MSLKRSAEILFVCLNQTFINLVQLMSQLVWISEILLHKIQLFLEGADKSLTLTAVILHQRVLVCVTAKV